MNMANWPIAPLNTAFALPSGGNAPAGFQLLQLLDADSDPFTTMGSDLVIMNGYVNFAINMQDINYNGHNFTITAGPVINVADTLDVWVSDFNTARPAPRSSPSTTTRRPTSSCRPRVVSSNLGRPPSLITDRHGDQC